MKRTLTHQQNLWLLKFYINRLNTTNSREAMSVYSNKIFNLKKEIAENEKFNNNANHAANQSNTNNLPTFHALPISSAFFNGGDFSFSHN